MNGLGRCYEFGLGVPKDLRRAANCYRASATGGFFWAHSNYAFCLQRGIGVEPNLAEAARYYKIAAVQGDPLAAFEFAICLHYGIGIDADLDEAVFYYLFASFKRISRASRHSFRCLRSLNAARFQWEQFPELPVGRLESFQRCFKARPFTPPKFVADYMTEPYEFTKDNKIGTGGSSLVTEAIDADNGRKIAIKYLFGYNSKKDRINFINEVEALVKLNHPYVLRILGYSMPTQATCAQIQTEYAANGSLDSVLRSVKRGSHYPFWNATGKGIIICGIVLGMRYVHSEGIMHRDLKPANRLLDGDGRVLIGDFGTSRLEYDDATFTSNAGTVHYAAPEQFLDDTYTRQVDVFSFGSILYEILVGSPVFPSSERPFPVMRKLLAGEMPLIPGRCGTLMHNLIHRCWSLNPDSRPSFDMILSELRGNDFDIIPGANADLIAEYVVGVLEWERSRAASQQ
jgi:hypothetical protein